MQTPLRERDAKDLEAAGREIFTNSPFKVQNNEVRKKIHHLTPSLKSSRGPAIRHSLNNPSSRPRSQAERKSATFFLQGYTHLGADEKTSNSYGSKLK